MSDSYAMNQPITTNNPIVKKILMEFYELRPLRQVWDGHWQDIKELVRCDTSDFNRKMVAGYRRYDLVYDGTAIDACEELASGLSSSLCSATERWFEIGIVPEQDKFLQASQNPDCLAWFEVVADIIFNTFSDTRSNFNPTMHECFLDLGSFGTCVMHEAWDHKAKHIVFRSNALAEFHCVENSKGKVDKVYRYFEWTGRKIMDEWPDMDCPKLAEAIAKDTGGQKVFRLIQVVGPRMDRVFGGKYAKNKNFMSIYVCETTQELIYEGGYDEMSYVVSRWVKQAEEVFGRGPAMKCLPDIKSLQAMQKVLLKAGQKAVDPPLLVPDEGFLLPIKTSPGSINYQETGTGKVEVLKFEGNLDYGIKQVEQKQAYIRKCFYEDWFKRFHKNREQSATEVEDDRDEMLRFLGPMLGRQQTELLGPIIQRTYNILHRQGLIPPAPSLIHRASLQIGYISPAARAQQGVKADRMSRVFQDMTPLSTVNPNIWDSIDLDKAVQVYAVSRGMPRSLMRSDQDVAKIRADKAKQQQMQQMAQTAEPASNAIKNIAQANSLNNGGGGQ